VLPMTTPDRRISVVLVDDHGLVREGLRELLTVEGDIVVVGEAANSAEAVERVAEHQPDVILLDVEIPGADVAVTVVRIQQVSPNSRILILSMYDGPQLLRRLLALGVGGYLLKSVDRAELVSAIRSVHHVPAQAHGEPESMLSTREREILELVAQALSNSQVASRLHITEATVKRHLRNVFVKLGAVSRIDAVNKAVAGSLISRRPDQPSRPFTG
jgi:DNA-binding NarL/FixJ family response regulator